MAMASSPTRGRVSAKVAAGSDERDARTTARSVWGSVATSWPVTRWPSAKPTSMRRAPATTWLLVTITPSLLQTTPLPSPRSVRMATTDGWSRATMSGMGERSAATPAPAPVPAAVEAGAASGSLESSEQAVRATARASSPADSQRRTASDVTIIDPLRSCPRTAFLPSELQPQSSSPCSAVAHEPAGSGRRSDSSA